MARARPEHIIEHVTRVRSISVSCFVYDVQIIFCLFHGTFEVTIVICILTEIRLEFWPQFYYDNRMLNSNPFFQTTIATSIKTYKFGQNYKFG